MRRKSIPRRYVRAVPGAMNSRTAARRYVHLFRQDADGVSRPMTPTLSRPFPQTGCACEYHRWARSQCLGVEEMMPEPCVLHRTGPMRRAARALALDKFLDAPPSSPSDDVSATTVYNPNKKPKHA